MQNSSLKNHPKINPENNILLNSYFSLGLPVIRNEFLMKDLKQILQDNLKDYKTMMTHLLSNLKVSHNFIENPE